MGWTDRRSNEESGFTFVELMVVLFIIGLAASVVVLAIPEPQGSLESEAERFAARTKAARDTAIIQSRSAAVRLGPGGYSLSIRQAGEWQEAGRYEWTSGTRMRTWGGEGVRVGEGAGGGAEAGTRFDSTGLATPLRVVLERDQRRVAVEIAHDGSILVRR